MKCPNKNLEEWKLLEKELGEERAMRVYLAAGEDLPPLAVIKEIIQQIQTNTQTKIQSNNTLQEELQIQQSKPLHIQQGYSSIQEKINYLSEYVNDYTSENILGEEMNRKCK